MRSDLQMSKEEAIKRVEAMVPDKRNQQSIVNLMVGKENDEKIVHQIPGGANLLEQISQETLPSAIYTWLRRTRNFTRFEISLVGNYDVYEDLADKFFIKAKKIKETDFGWKPGSTFYWQKKGIRELSKLISEAMNKHENIVSIIVEKEGIFVITDLSKEPFSINSTFWNPTLLIHRN